MKTRLIAALRTVGRKLANGELEYDWNKADQCNCGILAQELLGVNAAGLRTMRHNSGVCHVGVWSIAARAGFCGTTGVPISAVFKALTEAGLSKADFYDLENTANPIVAERIGLELSDLRPYGGEGLVPRCGFGPINPKGTATNVSRYMLAWADILEEADNAAMEAYEARPLIHLNKKAQPHKEAGPTMCDGATMVPAAQQP